MPSGYVERFERYKEEIEQIVFTDTPIGGQMNKYGDLVSYIRQSVLRYGYNAEQKMASVGVSLSKEKVAAIIIKLKDISVPKEICIKNRN